MASPRNSDPPVGVPLQVKASSKRKTRVIDRYRPPEHIKGVKHIVEGFKTLKLRERTGGIPAYGSYGPDSEKRGQTAPYQVATMQNTRFNEDSRQAFESGIAKFLKSQRQRRRIPTLPDPDRDYYGQEKKQARARMRGVLGTLLTMNREKLG